MEALARLLLLPTSPSLAPEGQRSPHNCPFDELTEASVDRFEQPVFVLSETHEIVWINAAGRERYSARPLEAKFRPESFWSNSVTEKWAAAWDEVWRMGFACFRTGTGVAKDATVVLAQFRPRGGPALIIVVIREKDAHSNLISHLRRKADSDPLTGLLSRAAFFNELDRIRGSMEGTGRSGFILAIVDLDDFKSINDTVGHLAGDAVLEMVGARLGNMGLTGAKIGRIGGDEFAVVQRLDETTANLEGFERALSCVGKPVDYKGRILPCSASVGIALFPDHGGSVQEVFRSADLALYESKAKGKGRTTHFNSELRDIAQRKAQVLEVARSAARERRIKPYYQPKVEIRTGRVIGYEALARVETTTGSILSGGAIADSFEDASLGPQISHLMLDQIVDDLIAWVQKGSAPRVAINVTENDLCSDAFIAHLTSSIGSNGIDARHLEIEVTENVFLDRSAGRIERVLRHLQGLGIKISLDDFGTGHASLVHLRSYPVDEIKVDQQFIRTIETDPDSRAIVRAIVGLGRSLSLDVVAEGVESKLQERLLAAMRCQFAQGYLYAQAVPFSEVQVMQSPISEGWEDDCKHVVVC